MTNFTELSNEQLLGLRAEVDAEIARRNSAVPQVRITRTFSSYNFRRYSKPWMARVTAWPVGGKPELEFGRYLGNDDGGEVEIMARPGDIIRWGQRDGRGNKTVNNWGVVEADGTLREITQAEARTLFGK